MAGVVARVGVFVRLVVRRGGEGSGGSARFGGWGLRGREGAEVGVADWADAGADGLVEVGGVGLLCGVVLGLRSVIEGAVWDRWLGRGVLHMGT